MSNIEKIKSVRAELGIGVVEAKLLVDQFDTAELAVEHWHQKQEEERQIELARKFEDPKFYLKSCIWNFKAIDPADISSLNCFSNNYAKLLWNEYVSEKSNHLMRPDAEEFWKFKNTKQLSYNWIDDWDNRQYPAFQENMQAAIDWDLEAEIYLLWGRYSGFKMKWSIFFKYWVPFLYQTYRTVIINPNDKKIIIFEEFGSITLGERIGPSLN